MKQLKVLQQITGLRVFKLLAGIAIFFAVAGIALYFALPPIVKPILVEKMSQALHRDVAIGQISINPFNLTAAVSGLAVREPGAEQAFISFDEVYVNAQGLSSLLKGALILKEVRVTRPFVNISRHGDGTYNFSDLIPKAEPGQPEKEKKPFLFSLNNIRIINGSLDFDDQPASTRHRVSEMELSVPFISNIEHEVDIFVEPRFSARVNGKQYDLAGKTKPFAESREMSVYLELQDVDIPHYLNYIPAKLNCKLLSAILDAKLNVNFIIPKGAAPQLSIAGNVSLRDFAIDDLQKSKVIRLPAVDVVVESLQPLIPDVHLSKVSIQSPEMVVRRDGEGHINLASLFAAQPGGTPAKKPAPELERSVPNPAGDKKAKLKARVDEFAITSGKLSFVDNSTRRPVRVGVKPFNLKVVRLAVGAGDAPADLDLSLATDERGALSVKGPLRIDPELSADLQVAARNINIRPFQPYFTDKVRITVKRGAVSTAGNFRLAADRSGKPSFKYAGSITVSNLATMDRAYSNDFVNWKQLYFDGFEFNSSPLAVSIKGISLTDFYARVIVNNDGSTNLKKVFGPDKPAEKGGEGEQAAEEAGGPRQKTAKRGEKPASNIKIGKVTFQGGTIDFTDHLIKPNFSAQMLNIGGSVSGLSSIESSRAKVDLRGNLGRGAPIEIKGEINPLIKDVYANVDLIFRDIEMSPATPYALKFLGYPITKGKLTFDVAYLVENRKLEAKNKVFIDQLTFGDRVEAPGALKLPMPLAVSLLSDRNGQINLDIPLSGSLDDPKFSVWPIVWKVIVNLLTKAVTAPFSVIASLVGGGEELSYVEFDYGSDQLTKSGAEKITMLAKALAERPALKLDVAGFADAEKDREGLKQAALARKVKAQKLRELVRKGDSAVALDSVRVEPHEYEKYLKLAYKAEKFPKPRNIIGFAKDLPVNEMEKLIVTHFQVTGSDLRLLASRRAENIKDLLIKKDVPSGRIFMVEPKAAPEKKENVKASRVEFKLK